MKPTAEHYDLIRRPIVTEKSTKESANNTIVFETAVSANKKSIKEAVEAIFSVKVLRVNTIISKGKNVRFRGREGRRKDTKKAYVRLAQGNTIDLGGRV